MSTGASPADSSIPRNLGSYSCRLGQPASARLVDLGEVPFAQAQVLRRHLEQFVVGEEVERLKASEGLDERSALKVIARARGISRSEAYRQLQLEKSAKK